MGSLMLNGINYSGGEGSAVEPNPAGTPTATLNKLGIEGTIYGIEGSGGGNVYGAFIDTNRVIYDGFVFDDTEQMWTVTEDCMLAGYLDAPNSSRSCYINIDGIDVFIDYETHNGVLIPVKSGQVISYLGKSSSVMKAYGLTFGTQNIFTPQIYSTEERCVGVWKDNKPLYQKTIPFSNVSNSGTVSFGIADVDNIFLVSGKVSESSPLPYVHGSAPSNNVGGFFNISQADTGWSFRCGNDAPSTLSGWICVAYTKTTDTAGSGMYNSLGVPMVHYSTDEQIVGTWIDGKTIYQKTCNVTTNTNCDNTTWTSLPLDNPPANADYMVDAELHGQCPNTNRTYRFQFEDGAVKIASLTSEYILANTKITFRYTKSSS